MLTCCFVCVCGGGAIKAEQDCRLVLPGVLVLCSPFEGGELSTR